MKKAKLMIFALIPLLASCGSDMEVEQPIGDGKVENDAVTVKYSMPSSLSSGDKITFNVSMEKDAPREDVSMALSYDHPLISNSYSESVLFSIKSDDLVSTINEDALKIEHVFSDLNNYFKKTEDVGTFYFVFHRESWTKRDVTSYSAMTYKYTFNGEKMNLIDD